MNTSQAEKAKKFQALHAGPGAFIIPNPWDQGSARMLAALGFQALATTSAGYAFSLGRRDGAVGRDAMLAHCREIVAATELPVSADLENCFGDRPEVVAETVRMAAATGLVGCSVEDASGDPARPIYDFALAVERVAAAVAAARAQPFPFTLTARAENFLHGRSDLDDTIKRLEAFAAAGADVLYAPVLPSKDAIKAVCTAVAPKPVNVLTAGVVATMSLDELSALGARRISVGGALARAAYGAFLRAAREMKERGTFAFLAEAATSAEITGFMAAS